jgi:hypothetical protein
MNISPAPADFKSSEKGSLEKLKKWLQAPLPLAMYSNRGQALGKLKSFHERALQFTCKELSCPASDPTSSTYNHGPTKHSWASVLLDWVCICFQFCLKYFTKSFVTKRLSQTKNHVTGAITSTKCGQVFTDEEMNTIWSIIEETMTPSSLTSVSSNQHSRQNLRMQSTLFTSRNKTFPPTTCLLL